MACVDNHTQVCGERSFAVGYKQIVDLWMNEWMNGWMDGWMDCEMDNGMVMDGRVNWSLAG